MRRGRGHGILVYSGGEPVGWCQYGLREDLPRMDYTRAYRKIALGASPERLWRITCFLVERSHRQSGAASFGLKVALEAIKRDGGGIVEAYPVTHWGARAHWYGIISMFRKEGFETVSPFGEGNVLMRRRV